MHSATFLDPRGHPFGVCHFDCNTYQIFSSLEVLRFHFLLDPNPDPESPNG